MKAKVKYEIKMKKIVNLILVFAMVIALSGCSSNKTIANENGVHKYQAYGLFDEGQHKNPNIEYDLVIGNVVWSIILFETIFIPVILIGWYLYEPVGNKVTEEKMKGIVTH